jgi:hypothetical protein
MDAYRRSHQRSLLSATGARPGGNEGPRTARLQRQRVEEARRDAEAGNALRFAVVGNTELVNGPGRKRIE